MKKKAALLLISALLIFTATACNSSPAKSGDAKPTNPSSNATDTATQPANGANSENSKPTEQATEEIFDVTKAYVNKPYSDEYALKRVDELQYIDDKSLYHLFSGEPTPIFYDGFFHEKGVFNVDMEKYTYEKDNETVRKYFDTYEYSRLASAGAVRVIDSFVYNDKANSRMMYYCYYTVTSWGEGENCDRLFYYRDVINLNTNDNTIDVQEKIAIKTNLEVPKEITGDHNFHNVI